MGLPFDFIKGEGPQIERPIDERRPTSTRCASSSRARRWRTCSTAIRQIQRELRGRVPLIGFAGAPFTLASYAIEGGHSNNFAHTKALMYGHPEAWHRLCEKFADDRRATTCRADRGRRRRGAGVRLVGRRAERRRLPRVRAAPHADASSTPSPERVPTIHFGTGTATILEELREAGGDVIGVDWRIPIDEAWDTHRRRPRRSGQSRSDAAARPAGAHVRSRPTTCCSASAAVPVTSSISATASCHPRRSSTCRCSRSTSTRPRAVD